MDGIQSLHDRIDELHQLVAQRLAAEGVQAGDWLHDVGTAAEHGLPARPAWRRRTQGELRYPASLTTGLAIGLQTAIPDRLVLVTPSWVLPAAQGALLLVLISANPRRINRRSRITRMVSLALGGLLMLASGWAVGRLAVSITQGHLGENGGQLLITGAVIWLNNVIVFALWYWELDRGGPVARALNLGNPYPDFQFVQMVSPPAMVSPDWEPAFLDYLYLAFTNAAAFSPTDVLPMSRWAKLAMTAQAVISIVTVALVVSRAVNVLPSG
ncbi:MAG TPA: hypothetical protein VGD91_11555 [Trebonia sp.]